jgi:hypothetical protein
VDVGRGCGTSLLANLWGLVFPVGGTEQVLRFEVESTLVTGPADFEARLQRLADGDQSDHSRLP